MSDFVTHITFNDQGDFLKMIRPMVKVNDAVFVSRLAKDQPAVYVILLPSNRTLSIRVMAGETEPFEEQLEGMGFNLFAAGIEFTRP